MRQQLPSMAEVLKHQLCYMERTFDNNSYIAENSQRIINVFLLPKT